MKKLPNLDGLRFIAALLVVLHHVDLALSMNHFKSAAYDIFPFNFGHLAVVLFFVLSGFLITWLLLKEKENTGIAVRSFYVRRILRIWPLYYLIIILSFFVFNNLDFFNWNGLTTISELHIDKTAYTIFILIICPNLALMGVNSLGYANPTWSIGVEEQFYLLWPHIMKRKRPEIFIVAIILIVFFLSHGFLIKTASLLSDAGVIAANGKVYSILFIINRFFTSASVYSFKIDAMAIGAAGAMIAFYKKNILRYIFSIPFQLVFYGIFLLAIFFLIDILPYQVFSIFFILLILNLAFNDRSILNLEHKVLNYLGKISYGIYIFHLITIIPTIKFVTIILGMQLNLFSEIIICVLSMLLTVSIAAVSHKYFESYFLKLKSRLYNSNSNSGPVSNSPVSGNLSDRSYTS